MGIVLYCKVLISCRDPTYVTTCKWYFKLNILKTLLTYVRTYVPTCLPTYLLEVQAREKRPPSLIDLNNYIYSAAVSVNQYLGQLIENKERNTKKNQNYQNGSVICRNLLTELKKVMHT